MTDLNTAIEAAMHEWQTLPRWKRIELEREQQVNFIMNKLQHLVPEITYDKVRGMIR